ncbi:hypothetical protein Cni_G13651 [Canna indica]|uniref:Uncharacterized protein n=1 Tax=Canna indica TaxID=4628 RepID=A0AAQ3KD05_9LILI|nr:hypothetical protein Cni_G13651 [Canna indica]
MGNCIDLQKPVTWVDDEEDDWASSYRKQEEEEGINGSGTSTTEIKIKISKKQLEELLRQVDSERLPLRRALADLVSSGGESWDMLNHHDQEGHWKPELKSIPEVPE